MHHLVFVINFQIHSVSLTSLVSIHFLIHLSTHFSCHPRCRHLSLFQNLHYQQILRTTATQTYLSELVQTHAPPRALRSSDAPMLVVPRTHTKLARRAFFVAAPSTWNSLPADIRLCENIFSLSNVTCKPIYSNSLSPPVLRQAPLYFRT